MLLIGVLASVVWALTIVVENRGIVNHMEEKVMKIDKQEALKIAKDDALVQYRDLSIYDVMIELDDENWKIDYVLKNKDLQGGGPHYLISSETGEIVWRRYEQ